MKNIIKPLLIGGLQNLWQVGLVYPLNLLANIYFIIKARFKIHTTLDMVVATYVLCGIVSFIAGTFLAFIDGLNSIIILNAFKSFLVFMGVLVFFGAYQLQIDDLFEVASSLFGYTAIAILLTYIYLYLHSDLSIYQMRGAISWCSGWPQRWVVFAIVGHFVYLCRFDSFGEKSDLGFALIFLVILMLSGTRSAALGVIFGYISLGLFSRKDFFRLILIVVFFAAVILVFSAEMQSAFRINEFSELEGADSNGSINYRIQNLWPGIIDSLDSVRIVFGWGHAGVAYIPHKYFINQSQMSDIAGAESGSAESQYFDVLVRQGMVGLLLFLLILALGLCYSYRLYKSERVSNHRYLWKASIPWQVAIIFHGITTETLRLPLYSLFYFLFLGILSNGYYQLNRGRGAPIDFERKNSTFGVSNA